MESLESNDNSSDKARRVLSFLESDPRKVLPRRAMLAAQPELRLRVDTVRLRRIIDFISFKCSPVCSVARNEAIQGSDIDGGLVVVKEPVGEEPELALLRI